MSFVMECIAMVVIGTVLFVCRIVLPVLKEAIKTYEEERKRK